MRGKPRSPRKPNLFVQDTARRDELLNQVASTIAKIKAKGEKATIVDLIANKGFGAIEPDGEYGGARLEMGDHTICMSYDSIHDDVINVAIFLTEELEDDYSDIDSSDKIAIIAQEPCTLQESITQIYAKRMGLRYDFLAGTIVIDELELTTFLIILQESGKL